jgi:hypothetical protein
MTNGDPAKVDRPSRIGAEFAVIFSVRHVTPWGNAMPDTFCYAKHSDFPAAGEPPCGGSCGKVEAHDGAHHCNSGSHFPDSKADFGP